MRNKFIYFAAVALVASGSAFASTMGELPASKVGEQQGGNVAVCSYALPASVGTLQLQNAGSSLNGELPGTVLNALLGDTFPKSMLLPGTDTNATSLLSKQLSGL